MKLVANKPCTLSGKRYFIGEEIPAEAVTDPVALEKMGVLTVIRDGIPVETLEECAASVGEVFFKIEIVKGDKGFDLDVTEPQLQEAVKTMQMNQKDAVAHTNKLDQTSDGLREWLSGGNLDYWSNAGRWFAFLSFGLGISWWGCAARLSASGRCAKAAA